MLFKTLFSGSSGNCHYCNIDNYNILIDCGGDLSKLKRELLKLNIELKQINYCLITHYHSDHSKNIKYLKKAKIIFGKEVEKLPFKVDYFKTFHDTKFSYGYIINSNIAIITDTGKVNNEILDKCKNCKIIAIESNYNYDLLVISDIPFNLKQRILSNKGHLSNENCFDFLEKCNNEITILLHISKQRNTIEILENKYKNYDKKIYFGKSELLKIKE